MWYQGIVRLRQKLDRNAPLVYASTWEEQHRRGWRFAINLPVNGHGTVAALEDYQNVHGVTNVTVGHAFDTKAHSPQADADMIGIYVRDVDDLVQSLTKALDDDERVARWINRRAS